MNTDFFSMTMKHFRYLITHYGFSVKKIEQSERSPQTEGRIEFESSTTFVTVSSEQFGADACIGRVKDDKYYYNVDPRTIHEYLSLTEADKQLVCSINPSDKRRAKERLYQVRLLHTNVNTSSSVERIDSQLADYSKWLRQYAEPFLRGDFSTWLEIYEYTLNRQKAEHLRSGRDEFIRTGRSTGEHKVSVYQHDLDYIDKLRKEYQK